MQSIIKHDRVSVADGSAEVPSALPSRGNPSGSPGSPGSPGARGTPRCKKSVQLLREKDVVRAVEVRCSCGETTVIEFEYDPANAGGA